MIAEERLQRREAPIMDDCEGFPKIVLYIISGVDFKFKAKAGQWSQFSFAKSAELTNWLRLESFCEEQYRIIILLMS